MSQNTRTVRMQLYQSKVVGFMGQEQTPSLNAIPNDAKVVFCYGTLLLQHIFVPIVLFQLGNNTIYMVSFNYQSESERHCLECLGNQDSLYLIFYNESHRRSRHIITSNLISEFFRKSREFLAKLPSASLSALHQAQLKLQTIRAKEIWKQFATTS